MYIKIIKCSNENFWYSNLINKEFEIVEYDDLHKEYIVSNIDGTNKTKGSIKAEDAIEIEDINEGFRFLVEKKITQDEIFAKMLIELQVSLKEKEKQIEDLQKIINT